MKIGILARKLERLVPDQRVDTQLWGPDELDKVALTLGVEKSEGVDTKSLHHAIRARNATVAHGPHKHMRGLGVVELEVPEVVVCRLGLGYLVVRLGFGGVDDVGKLDGILDKEDGNVVADQIPVTLLGVELDSEPTHITNRIGAPAAAKDSREADEHRRYARRICQDGRKRHVLGTLVHAELSECTATARVDNSLGDPLMIKAVDLD